MLANLLAALANGRAFLRVGGNGPEAPCPGDVHHPASTAINAILAVERPLNALLLLGTDLEAHRLAKVHREVVALLKGIDPRRPHPRLAGFEIGNEPDRYPRYGPSVPPAKTGPFFTRYMRDFSLWAAVIHHSAGDGRIPIAGPSLGREGLPWITGPNAPNLARFANGPAHPRYLTFHSYPLHGGSPCPHPDCPSMSYLLLDRSSRGLAAPISTFVGRAPRGHPVRVDEINSITGGGALGISTTFAAALWALDTTFEMAHAGAVGVNFHTFSNAAYALFSNGPSQVAGSSRVLRIADVREGRAHRLAPAHREAPAGSTRRTLT